MKKKLLALFLAFAMLLSQTSSVAFAAQTDELTEESAAEELTEISEEASEEASIEEIEGILTEEASVEETKEVIEEVVEEVTEEVSVETAEVSEEATAEVTEEVVSEEPSVEETEEVVSEEVPAEVTEEVVSEEPSVEETEEVVSEEVPVEVTEEVVSEEATEEAPVETEEVIEETPVEETEEVIEEYPEEVISEEEAGALDEGAIYEFPEQTMYLLPVDRYNFESSYREILDEEEYMLPVTGVSVYSGDASIINIIKEDEHYVIEAAGQYGIVKVKMYYTDISGTRRSWVITIHIVNEIYGGFIGSSSYSSNTLPGQDVELWAFANIRYINEYGDAEVDNSPELQYVWEYDDFADDYIVSSGVDADSPMHYTLTLLDDIESDLDFNVRVTGYALDDTNQTNPLLHFVFTVNVRNCYYEVWPNHLDDIFPGTTVKINPEIRMHEYKNGSPSCTILNYGQDDDEEYLISYILDYNENAFLITNSWGVRIRSGERFMNGCSIKALSPNEESIQIIGLIEIDAGEWDAYTLTWHQNDRSRYFSFEFADDYVFPGQDANIVLNTEEMADYKDDEGNPTYKLGWRIGCFDNKGELIHELDSSAYEFSEDGKTLTISGNELAKDEYIVNNGGVSVNVYAETIDGYWLCDQWTFIEFRNTELNIEFPLPENCSKLPGWSDCFDNKMNCWIKDPVHPDGENFQLDITDVCLEFEDNREDNDELCDYAFFHEEDGRCTIEYYNNGTIKVIIEYEDPYGEQKTYESIVTIGSDVYDTWIDIEGGHERFLPGSEITLIAGSSHQYFIDEEYGSVSTEDYTYVWEYPDSVSEYLNVEVDEENSAILHITACDMPENWDYMDIWFGFTVKAYESADNCVSVGSRDINICSDFDMFSLYGTTERLRTGSSMDLHLEELHCSLSKGIETLENVSYMLSYDSNGLSITYADGTPLKMIEENCFEVPAYTADLKVTKLKNWDTNLQIQVSKTEEDGNNYFADNVNIFFQHTVDCGWHNFTPVKGTVTCTKAGTADCWYCVNCDTYFNNIDDTDNPWDIDGPITVPALGHDYKDVLKKATLTTDGIDAHVCRRCLDLQTEIIYAPTYFTLSGTTFSYDGKTHKPTIVIKDSKKKVISSANYSLKYSSGLKSVGKYAVVVTFKGNYSGSKKLYFVINPKDTAVSSVTAASKGFTVKWAKNTSADGYEIQYSTSSKFSSSTTKTITIKGYSTVAKKVTGLTAKKTYYVRIRAKKTVKDVVYYSNWSKAVKVTTK